MRLMYSSLTAVLLVILIACSSTASIDQFGGSWTNVDPNTGGITRLDIAASGSLVKVHAWGRCHPTDCDWGTVQAQPFAASASSDIASADTLIAVFDSGFSETTLVIKPAGNRLNVNSYDRFKDNSGRSNYMASYTFQKAASAGGAESTPAPMDLTGVWNCDDGGKYYVRQLGSAIWWYGENDAKNPSWSNVLRGTIGGNVINAEWSDVPKGSVMSNGKLVLQIVSNKKMMATSKTGGFGGSVWTR
ncbi:MAG: hypothetical protein QUS07_00460 [Methanothrix sp.]|nr:hypothetical protein [Methanothrix sp.]